MISMLGGDAIVLTEAMTLNAVNSLLLEVNTVPFSTLLIDLPEREDLINTSFNPVSLYPISLSTLDVIQCILVILRNILQAVAIR